VKLTNIAAICKAANPINVANPPTDRDGRPICTARTAPNAQLAANPKVEMISAIV
jgi:hypothetical protein